MVPAVCRAVRGAHGARRNLPLSFCPARELSYPVQPCVIWVAIAIELGLAIKYGHAWPDFGVLCGLQFINGTVSFYESFKSGSAVAALKASLKPFALVKRDGAWGNIQAALLVPGDLVKLDAGKHVPADTRVHAGSIQVDQSALTGESLPVTMGAGGEPKMGSTVTRGEVEAVVTATGKKTVFGRTAALIGSVEQTPRFQTVMYRIMVYLITISIILSCTVLGFLIGSQKQTFENAIGTTVIVLVVSVPLAMEVVTTSTMAIGSRLLSSEGAIVARLGSIEELAGMNMLCSDKTGTLTLNKMVIQDETPAMAPGLSRAHVLHFAALATKWREPAKDAIDQLVLSSADVGRLDAFEQLGFEPFDPRLKRNEATVRDAATGEAFKVTKGAPHVVAALLPPEDESVREAVEEATARLAQRGIRTLAVARTEADVEPERWRLLGLLTFLDPPRPDTKVTLEKAATLGVGCKMVTGDNQLIAKETARVLGLGTNILNAVGLPSLDEHGKPPEDFARYVPDIICADGFAQVFPEHKFLIVEAFRRYGFSVAMTGDGVNDAPALKRADIGIAVQGATDAARASADIVLTQPGLSTIITAIVSARRICRRIKSFVIYRVACTLQILCFLYIAIIAFQPSSYATGQRSAKSINIPLAVLGDGGRPGGVVVMWAHNSCEYRNPLDLAAMAQGLGQYATNVSAASILEYAQQRHSPEWYFARHPGISLDAGANTVSGPICVEQVPRVFTLPLLALIIITCLNDGTIISIAYDNVRAAHRPEHWDLGRLFVISGVLGIIALASSILLLYLLLQSHDPADVWNRLGFPPLLYGHVTAAMYLKVSLSDYLTLFSARTRSWFGSIVPSWPLMGAALAALAASSALAAKWPHQLNGNHLQNRFLRLQGFEEQQPVFREIQATSGERMQGIPAKIVGFVWIYCLLWFVVMDAVKVLLYWALRKYDSHVARREQQLDRQSTGEATEGSSGVQLADVTVGAA